MNLDALHLPPLFVWGLLPRLVGLVFFISFLSLRRQLMPLAGSDGVSPLAQLHGRIRCDFPAPWRLFYFPSLLLPSDRDGMLRALPWIGMAAALGVVYGGPFGLWALGLCYLIYLCLDRAVGLVFPWDCVLFEAALLGLLLPPVHALPEISATAAPLPALVWAHRLLVIRVLLGFGKFKFLGAGPQDLGYLKGFLIWQPLPTKLGWYAQKLPMPALKAALWIMFLIEIPGALLMFFPGDLGIVAGLATLLLMVGIQLSGNFGYFNLALGALCVAFFDTQTAGELTLGSLQSTAPAALATHVILALHTFGALFMFPMNSFAAHGWPHWPLWLRLPAVFRVPIAFYRGMHPFRWLHSYGVFPPKTIAGVKFAPVLELSWDRESWHECGHRFSPTRPESEPRFIAPHHPRGDQAMIYESVGMGDTSLFHNLLGHGHPYAQSGARALLQRLLEGKTYGDVFIDAAALPPRDHAPVAARIRTHLLSPASLEEHRREGHYWRRRYIGPHLPETGFREGFWERRLPEPELWHFEDLVWKRRSRLGPMMKRARAGECDDALLLDATDELSVADIERFWGEFLPAMGSGDPEAWANLSDRVTQLRDAYDPAALHRMERIHGRLQLMLAARLETGFFAGGLGGLFGSQQAPAMSRQSYFRLGLLAHHIIAMGRAEFEAVMGEPRRAVDHLGTMTLHSGMHYMGVFRYDELVFEAQKLRLFQRFTEPEGQARPPENATLDGIARRAWGALELTLFVREQFIGPAYERGQPEQYPSFALDETGEVVIVEGSTS